MGWRRHHPLVLVVTGLNIAFALFFSVIVPLYRGPDEREHVDMIRHYRTISGNPSPNLVTPEISVVLNLKKGHKFESPGNPAKPLQASDATARGSRPTFSQLGLPQINAPNQMTQHPPLDYAVTAGVSSLVTGMTPAGLWSYDREVYFYRLLSIIATAPLALLASAALLAMKCSKRVALIASAFTLLIPEKTFVGSVVNNDGLMIVLAALSVAAGLRYLGGGSRRSAWLAAAAGAGAALTKATGATIAAWAVLVVAIGAYERWNRGDHRDAMAALGGTLVFAAIGSAWYVRNLVEFHNPQPAPAGHPRPLGATKLSFVSFLPSWLDRISQTFWGVPARRLGIALPWWVSHALSVLTVAAVLTAVITGRRLWKYTLPLLAVCLADVLLLLRSDRLANRVHVPGSEYAGVQGRYLFALIVPLAAFVALAIGRLAIRSSRWILGIAIAEIAVGCALHLVLAREMFSRFWAGGGAPFFDHLRAVLAWSPLPVPLTGALLLLPFVLMVALAVSGVRYARVTQAMSPEETLSIPAAGPIASEV